MNATSSRIQSLIFDKKKFDREKAVAWAKKRDFRTSDVRMTGSSVRLRQRPLAGGETEYRTIKLTDGVKAVLELLPSDVGKMSVQGAGGGGAAPALIDSALPDFKTIYYQPEDAESVKHDAEVQEVRRRSLARMNSGKFGLHGATTSKPQVQYHPGDYPAVTRGQANDPAGRAPKLIVRDQNMRPPKRKDPTP